MSTNEKWAVDIINYELNETVRYMETPIEAVARTFVKRINAVVTKSSLAYYSRIL